MGDGMDIENDPAFLADLQQQLMKVYYERLFPVQAFSKWLAYGNDGKHPQASKSYFQRREFCFTLPEDIFVRYQSFQDGADLHSGLMKRCPARIDLGPVYNVDPRKRNAYSDVGSGFVPVERELVFDIDLTDYDDVRLLTDDVFPKKDWAFMVAAIQVLDKGLREDFGFKHILWVFSGRRGVHCWVCDQRARALSDTERAAVASYFTVYKGQEKDMAKINVSNCSHPAIHRAYGICEKIWIESVLSEQMIFEDEQKAERIFSKVPDAYIVDKAKNVKAKNDQDINQAIWRKICEEIEKKPTAEKKAKSKLMRAKEEIVLAHVYPRLDVEVSKKRNHLLKAPFCVHPKTGKICVPIDPTDPWNFDPTNVPTLQKVVEEMRASDREMGENAQGSSNVWKNTCLEPYVALFNRTFLDPLMATVMHEFGEKARESKNIFAW